MDMSKNNIEDTKDEVVLCGASAYNKKYYLNENFMGLPDSIKEELRIMCVLYTEEIGGILQLVFDEKGNLEFKTSSKEGDLLYDDIGSILKIKQLQNIASILITFWVLNDNRTKFLREKQPLNIPLISLTFWVLKFDKSKYFK